MKKYLFGLGTMLVGVGLMFVLTQNEVQADANPEPCVCSTPVGFKNSGGKFDKNWGFITNCRCGKLNCATTRYLMGVEDQGDLSCNSSGGIFK